VRGCEVGAKRVEICPAPCTSLSCIALLNANPPIKDKYLWIKISSKNSMHVMGSSNMTLSILRKGLKTGPLSSLLFSKSYNKSSPVWHDTPRLAPQKAVDLVFLFFFFFFFFFFLIN
jgi:hypothetical protein